MEDAVKKTWNEFCDNWLAFCITGKIEFAQKYCQALDEYDMLLQDCQEME